MYYRYGYAWIKALQSVMTIDATKVERARSKNSVFRVPLLFFVNKSHVSYGSLEKRLLSLPLYNLYQSIYLYA